MADLFVFVINRDQVEKLAKDFSHDLEWIDTADLTIRNHGRRLIADDLKFFRLHPGRKPPVFAGIRLMILQAEFSKQQTGLREVLDEAGIEYAIDY